jgi:NADH-quinone oxidoreductase subunit J
MTTFLIFLIFAAAAVISAILVITRKNVMHSVLYLAFAVLSIAGVFFTLQAEYLGAIQILVYGGGIVVLYIFVIIIVNLDEIVPERRKLFPKAFIFAAPALLALEITNVLFMNQPTPPAGADRALDFETLAETLFTTYAVPFEIASILLLAVLIGAIMIAKRRLTRDSD